MRDRDEKALKREWEQTLAALARLVEEDAPPVLKAHYVVCVLLPRLARLVGTPEVAAELGRMAAKGLAAWAGTCQSCFRADAARGEDLCPACGAAFDQFCAEMDEELREADGETP